VVGDVLLYLLLPFGMVRKNVMHGAVDELGSGGERDRMQISQVKS